MVRRRASTLAVGSDWRALVSANHGGLTSFRDVLLVGAGTFARYLLARTGSPRTHSVRSTITHVAQSSGTRWSLSLPGIKLAPHGNFLGWIVGNSYGHLVLLLLEWKSMIKSRTTICFGNFCYRIRDLNQNSGGFYCSWCSWSKSASSSTGILTTNAAVERWSFGVRGYWMEWNNFEFKVQ